MVLGRGLEGHRSQDLQDLTGAMACWPCSRPLPLPRSCHSVPRPLYKGRLRPWEALAVPEVGWQQRPVAPEPDAGKSGAGHQGCRGESL